MQKPDLVQILVTPENEDRIYDILTKRGYTYSSGVNQIGYDRSFAQRWPYVYITENSLELGGNSRKDLTHYKLLSEQALVEWLEPPPKKKHQEATLTNWEDLEKEMDIKKEPNMPQDEIQKPMDYTTVHSTEDNLVPRDYTVQEVFDFPSQIKIKGYEPGHPLVPTMDHKYVWEAKMAKDMIEWLSEDNPDPLWLQGQTGCGKTDALKSVFAALNIPTVIISAKSSTEPDDILGRTQLRGGDTVFVPGDLLKAYERGYAIIFDEIDGYNPEVGMAIHRLLEREVIVLDDGTVIKPAARNLIAATANTRGDGDGGDIYASTKAFNLATLNRFEKWEMGYPEAAVEEAILKNAFGASLDDTLVAAMVKTANDIRKAYQDGSCPGPISIRDVLRWGRKLKQSWNRKDVVPIYHSFDKAFGNGVSIHVRQLLHTIAQSHFGVAAPQLDGLL